MLPVARITGTSFICAPGPKMPYAINANSVQQLRGCHQVEQELDDEYPKRDRGYIRGQLLEDGDEDWYRMKDAAENAQFVLRFESYGALGDLAVDIHDPEGELLQTVTGSNDNARY